MQKLTKLWIIEILLILASLYFLLGVVQAAWLSATPNYPLERAQFNVSLWGSLFVVSAIFSVIIGVFIVKYVRESKRTINRIKKIEEKALTKLRNKNGTE